MRIPTILAMAAALATIVISCPDVRFAAATPIPERADAAEPEEAASEPEEAASEPEEAASESEEAATESEADTKPDAESLFADGRDALFQGRYNDAIQLLTQAVAADGTKTSYRLHLARAYRYAGQVDQATGQLEEILKAAADHVEAGQTLAEIYTTANQWEDVVRVLEPLLKYRHDYPTYHMLAMAQYQLDRYDKARENFEEAIQLNPNSATDHYHLGSIYLAGNRFALAAESYEATLKLGLNTPVLRYKLASAYFNLRNYFGQIAVQQIPSGKPGTVHDAWYLIEAVPGHKDTFRCAPHRSAAYQLAKALEDGLEETPSIHLLRATIYLNAQRYQQAYEMFTKIGATVPEEDQALCTYYHAQAAFGTGDYNRYLNLLEEAIRLDPDAYQATLVDAFVRVADQYNQSGDLDRYIDYLVKAVKESPQTASLHLKLGNAYEETRQYDQAIAQWQMVLDLESDHAERLKLLNRIETYRTVDANHETH